LSSALASVLIYHNLWAGVIAKLMVSSRPKRFLALVHRVNEAVSAFPKVFGGEQHQMPS